MAGWPVEKNAAFTAVFPIYDADGDLVTGATSPDSEVSKDKGTFTDCTNEATELATSSGMYYLDLTATEMNADIVATITKSGTGKTAANVMYTSTRQIDDLAYPTISGRSIDVTTTGEVGVDLDNVNGTLDAAEIGADAITAAKIANGAIDAATFAAGAIDASAIAANAIGASEIADNAIDAAAIASNAITAAKIATDAITSDKLAASAITEIRSLVSGTADSGSTTTMVDAARTEADTDYWKGKWILFTSGTIANQVRLITGFTPATDTITFAPAVTQAVSTNTYEILPARAMDLRLWLGSAPNALQSGRVDSYVGAMASAVLTATAIATDAITAAKIATGAIDADAIAADAITAAKIATDAITADEIADAAANEIADAILKRDLDQVEATMALHSLGTAALKAVSRIRDNAGTLETYRTDGTTLHMSQTVTTDAALDPVDELTAGT